MTGVHFPGVELSLDPTAGDWIVQRLDRWSQHRGTAPASTVIPSGFEAYARIFHPARVASQRRVTWSDVAARSGRVVHPEMQWEAIASAVPGAAGGAAWLADGERPEEGNLGAGGTGALAAHLIPFTTTPGIAWFGIWEGYAVLHPDAGAPLRTGRSGRIGRLLARRRTARKRRSLRDGFDAIPKLRCDKRAYLLYRGPLTAIRAFHEQDRPHAYQSPNLWWPDDRAWCVATEISFDSTLIGGSRQAVDAVLASADFEALEITLSTRLDRLADRINR